MKVKWKRRKAEIIKKVLSIWTLLSDSNGRTRRTWFETPTIFCNQPHNSPLPMNELPKHRALMLEVARRATIGTPLRVVRPNMRGARRGEETAREYRTPGRSCDKKWVKGEDSRRKDNYVRVPANIAWFPADSTEVRITVFMNEAATSISLTLFSTFQNLNDNRKKAHLTLPRRKQSWREK